MNPIPMRDEFNRALHMTRRHLFGQASLGLGTAALASLNTGGLAMASNNAGLPELPHFAPKAKRAIYLFMAGAPSQLDTFDYKPKLDDLFNEDLRKMPDVQKGQRITTMTSGQSSLPIAPSKFKFAQHGESRAWVSDLLHYTAKMVDDIAIVKTVHTEAINHDPAITYICTGNQLPGKASLGAWLSYGLGSMNDNLPSFVVMTPTWTGRPEAQALYNRLWGSGFLPTKYQGVSLRSQGDPVLFLSNPPGIDRETRRSMLDRAAELNRQTYESWGDPQTRARVEQAEMAFRMSASVN